MRLFHRRRQSNSSTFFRRLPKLEILEDRTVPSADPLFGQFQSAGGLLALHGNGADHLALVSLLPDGFVQLNVAGQSFSSNPGAANFDPGLAGANAQTLQAIHLDGNAGLDHLVLGNISVAGGLSVQSDGIVDVQGHVSAPGPIQLSGQAVFITGQVRVDGANGGSISVSAVNVMQSGLLEANGTQGVGGSIIVDFTGHYVATVSADTSASSSGTGAGGLIEIDGGATGTLFSSGQYQASAGHGQGGDIELFGAQVHLVGASINASGASGGGWVRIGGDSPADIAAHGGSSAGVSFAGITTADATTTITADALAQGNGGRIVVWSQTGTTFGGTLQAHGAGTQGQGGLLEVSSAGTLTYGGHASATATSGQAGQLLLDPMNLIISDGVGFPQFSLINPDLPDNSDTFGGSMVLLSNGNIVVTDPSSGLAAADAGAVYLFNGQTGALLGTLTGSTSGDQVGSGGVTALTNGNYVVSSPFWQNAGVAVGAATWVSGSGGNITAVSANNSLVGSTSGDQVGIGDQQPGSTGITALSNGNYVVDSPFWQNAGAMVGAVTWGNGYVGTTGAVSASNSLIGSTAGDNIGSQGVSALNNGNYVVASPSWQISGVQVGAATWGNGLGTTVGPVSAANSLVGTANQGGIAGGGATALSDGNYVVVSPGWQDAGGNSVGAVTWGNGNGGITGALGAGNSLIGSTDFDLVGQGGVTALSNGSYVVSSPFWHDGGAAVGAVTWIAGNGSTSTVVSAANSIIGSTDGDNVGSSGITALTNGDYVISSPNWQSSPGVTVGAVTWGDGSGSTSAIVSATNSLVGSNNGDYVGFGNGNPGSGVKALSNGNYVVSSPNWQNSIGAVTWAKADGSTVGALSSSNSLVGSTPGDQVGSGGVTALSNGNYVVSSPSWQNGPNTVGAVTWSKADGSTVGAVTTGNSLSGSSNGDNVGNGGITVLSNGNYVVSNPNWQSGNTQVGAATWSNGSNGHTLDAAGSVDSLNSLIGAGSGALLQQILGIPGGSAFLASFSGNGGTVIDAQVAATSETYATAATQDMTISTSFLEATLDTGTAVVLQANNNITISSSIVVNNPLGKGGDLTLQSGNSILINANITTGNGNLTLIANDTAADGVLAGRLPNTVAAITMTAGTFIDAGIGNVTVTLSNGAGNTNFATDDITLGDITAQNITLTNNGPGDASIGGTGIGSGVDMASVTASGNLTVVSTGDITQAGALSQSDPGIINVSGTTRLTAAGGLIILNNHANVFTQTVTYTAPGGDVTLYASGTLTLASPSAAAKLTAAAGGLLDSSQFLNVSGAASFTGGTISLTNAFNNFQGAVSLSSTGTISLVNSSALTVGNLTLAGSASLSAPSITLNGNLNVGSQTLTLTSTGAAQLTGNTTLAGGTISDSSGLLVGVGATLSGSGTLQAGTGAAGVLTQVGATLAPGLTPGGLTVDGDLTLGTLSILSEQIKGTSQFGQLTVNGAINLGNATLQVGFQYTPAGGDHFQIVSNVPGTAITGTFAQGSSFTVNNTPLTLGYAGAGNNVVLTAVAPVVTVPGPQQFIANKNLVISGISASDPAFVEGNGMVTVSLSVQNGVLTLGNTFLAGFLSFTQGNGTANSSMIFSGPLVYVNLVLSGLTYHPNQDTAIPDTLTITATVGASVTQTVALNPTPNVVAVVADPVLAGKQDLVIQGTAGNDVVTVAPGKVAGAYLVSLNGPAQTYTGVTGRILAFGLGGNDSITLSSTVKLPGLLVVGDGANTLVGGAGNDTLVAGNGNNTMNGGAGTNAYQAGNGNNTLLGGAGNDTFTVGSGSNRIDGGAGTNTLIESGNVDFTLVGGTTTKSGTLTKGAATDTLVLNHIQQAQLSLTGPGSHTIDGTKFAGTETLMGGTGDDTLLAGNGNDVLVGGSGNDSLVAGGGKDLLIAGGGTDVLKGGALKGGANQDLMIGGGTTYDNNMAALNAVMAEWASTNTYAVKIKHLMGTLPGGKNGSTVLNAGTVLNSGQATITGGTGMNWYWKGVLDTFVLPSPRPGETVTQIS